MFEQPKTHVDLFSGIGGFALAASWCGLKTILFCENDEFCRGILKQHWPLTPIIDDVRNIEALAYHCKAGHEALQKRHSKEASLEIQPRRNDNGCNPFLLTGGFPCQPVSVAGRREGTTDNRWLWPEMFAVIRELHPTWVLAENSDRILTMDNGRVIASIQSDLEEEGYEVGIVVLPACSVAAPHRRYRAWIMAYSDRNEPQRGRTNRGMGDKEGAAEEEGYQRQRDGGAFGDGGEEAVGKSDEERRLERTGLRPRKEAQKRGRQSFDPSSEARGGSTPESGLGGVPDGVSSWLDWPAPRGGVQYEWEPPRVVGSTDREFNSYRKKRIMALGNAIVPEVAYQIIREML